MGIDHLRPMSLLKACEEALEAGYSEIYTPILGITRDLNEFMRELLISSGIDYQDYVRFGNMIVRLSDAWKEEAETYELS